VLVDALAAANLAGGTPPLVPEEVHPQTKEVFYLPDGAPGSDGYPDSRIFVVSKYSSAVSAAQPSGELFQIEDASSDGTGNTFRWSDLLRWGSRSKTDLVLLMWITWFSIARECLGCTDMSTSAQWFQYRRCRDSTSIDHQSGWRCSGRCYF